MLAPNETKCEKQWATYLVDVLCLLLLDFEELFDAILHYLSALLHTTCEGS